MEQNADTGVPVAPIAENKQKSGNGLKIATAIACVVAVCGIGFGVYGMIQSAQKDGQISNLKAQIKKDDGTITAIETPEIDNEAKDGPTSVVNGDSKDYIYVGEWNFKIKKPENWRDLVQKYVYHNDYPHAVDTFEIIENESVATSHAMISTGNGNCKNDEWTDCVEIKLGEKSILDVRVPKSDSGSVSEDFRKWVTNSDNYSRI